MRVVILASMAALASVANGFVVTQQQPSKNAVASSPSQRNFGFFPSSSDDDDSSAADGKPKKDIGLKGLAQLITAGMGAPFLGDYQGVDEETGKFMFSLEANNLTDEKGNSKQTSMPYFESGWVDEEELKKQEERKKNGGGFKLW